MIYVDPAHPAFPNLPRPQQAQIYFSMGWTKVAIGEELDADETTVRYWVDPEWRERKRADARDRARRAKGLGQ